MQTDHSVPTWRHAMPVGIVCFCILMLPVLLLLSHRNTVTALVLAGLAVAFYPATITSFLKIIRLGTLASSNATSVIAWLLLFCVFTLVSVLWSQMPTRADWSFRLVFFILAAASIIWLATAMHTQMAERTLLLYVLAVVASAVLLGVEAVTGGLLRDLIPPEGVSGKDIIASARGAGLGIYLAVPAVLALQVSHSIRQSLGAEVCRFMQVAIIAGFGAAAILLDISANILAFVSALAAAGFGYMRPRFALSLMFGGMIGAFFIFLVLALLLPPIEELQAMQSVPYSWLLRLISWRAATDYIFADFGSFVFGQGLGFCRFLFETGPVVELPLHPFEFPVIPTHTHNLFIQIWLEFGLIGVTIIVGALLQAMNLLHHSSLSRGECAAICGLGAVFFAFASVEISLWTLWRFTGPGIAIFGLVLARRLAA